MADEAPCDNPQCIAKLQRASDEIAGHIEAYRKLAATLGQARREDPDKKLRNHAQWKRCARLFRIWQRATGHTRSKFTVARFRLALPFLEIHEDEMICRGIEGIAYDPWMPRNKNGTRERRDGWKELFKSDDDFERYVNKAPLDWKDNLLEHAEEVAGRQ